MIIKMKGRSFRNIFEAAREYGTQEGILKLRDDRWYLRIADPSGSAMFASRVPEDAMDEYDAKDVDKVAVRFNKLIDFIPKTDEIVTLRYGQYGGGVNKTVIEHGNTEARVPATDIKSVSNTIEKIPSIDAPVIVNSSPDFLDNFTTNCENIGITVFNISPREGMFYLYGRYDDNELIERIHWEDFNNYSIDWSKGAIPDNIENPINPQEVNGVDCMIDTEFANDMIIWTDSAEFHIDNHQPLKVVFTDEEGISVSHMIAPRVPSDGEFRQLPDDVIKQRGLETA